jgi:hypothetical protein
VIPEQFDGQRGRGRGRGRGGRSGPGRGLPNSRAAAPKPPSDPLKPNGQNWYEVPTDHVKRLPEDIYDKDTCIRWSELPHHETLPESQMKKEIDYFRLTYPMQSLAETIRATKKNMFDAQAEVEASKNRNKKPFFDFTHARFLNYIGIELERTLHPLRGGIDACWSTGNVEGTFREGGRYGERFGMSLHEYKNIRQYLQLCSFSEIDRRNNPWVPIDSFVEAFNKRREKIIKPGRELIIDESMSWWLGADGEIVYGGMPHVSFVKRKPRPNGAEMKTTADVQSGVMLYIEIQKGKQQNNTADFADKYQHHVALSLRLSKPWHNTGRIVNGDAAFSSFACAVAHLENGLRFRGVLKQASKSYPKKFLQDWYSKKPLRGDHKVLETEVIVNSKRETVHAIGWADQTLKLVVSAHTSTTVKGPDIKKERNRILEDNNGIPYKNEKYHKLIPAPQIMSDLFNALNIIDIGDQNRQGTLALEDALKTHEWWFRLFITILGICIVDAYYIYSFEYKKIHFDDETHMRTILEFAERLSFQLITYTNAAEAPSRRRPLSNSGLPSLSHTLASLRNSPFYQRNEKVRDDPKYSITRNCSICRQHRANFYCIECSIGLNTDNPIHVCLCNPGGKRKSSCLSDHIDICYRSMRSNSD